jgi:tRNA(Ile)-lysidine synthase
MQVLKPVGSALVRKVTHTIDGRHLVDRGDRILVAVSGGPDSVALLSILSVLAPARNLSLRAAHFNHGLRGDESEEDARFVEAFCRRMNIGLTSERLPLVDAHGALQVQGRSLQEAARDARYAALTRIADAVEADKIAVGHTADDQAETLLMWMLRGAGLSGLSGIPLVRESRIIRPLLEVGRDEIVAYLHEHELPFRRDSSNDIPRYLRNRIRRDLLPVLKRFNPSIVEVLTRQATILRDENEWLERLTEEQARKLTIERSTDGLLVDHQGLIALPSALQRRVLRLLIKQTAGCWKGPSFRAVTALVKGVVHGRSGSMLTVHGVQVSRDYDRLRFARRVDGTRQTDRSPQDDGIVVPVPSTRMWPASGQRIRASLVHSYSRACEIGASRNCAVFDAGRLTMPLLLRSWKPGDAFYPLGMNGHRKKLQDYFADLKVPRHGRRRIPLLVAPEGIAWVCGYRMDHRFRVTSETATALLVELMPPDRPETI